jgi:hypothetical protein
MKKLLLAVCMLVPVAATGQTVSQGDARPQRDQGYEQEKQMRQLQSERLRQGLPEDPAVAQALREADVRRQAECRTERYNMYGSPMNCRVCPGRPTSCTY